MSALKLQLTEDMKNAMRAKDSLKLNAIRFLMSEIKNWEIDHGEQDDAGVQQVIAREVKKMKEAMAEFAQAGRTDLVDEEKLKLAVMEAYLPQQLSDDELQKIVSDVAAKTEPKVFGTVMKAVLAEVQGRADGGRVAALVKTAMGS